MIMRHEVLLLLIALTILMAEIILPKNKKESTVYTLEYSYSVSTPWLGSYHWKKVSYSGVCSEQMDLSIW